MAVLVSEPDPVRERALGRLLEPEVERELKPVARKRLLPRDDRADDPAPGVDAELVEAGVTAEIQVVRRFDPRLPDRVARLVALVAEMLELVR